MRPICVTQLAQTANIHEMRLFIARQILERIACKPANAHTQNRKNNLFLFEFARQICNTN